MNRVISEVYAAMFCAWLAVEPVARRAAHECVKVAESQRRVRSR